MCQIVEMAFMNNLVDFLLEQFSDKISNESHLSWVDNIFLIAESDLHFFFKR